MNTQTPSGNDRTHRKRLARALRALITEVVTCDAPEQKFQKIAEGIEELKETLADHPRRKRIIGTPENDELRWEGKTFHYGDLMDFSAMSGRANPVAPLMDMFTEDKKYMEAHITFTAAYEGPPGFVHGGYVAAAFDELLGLVQALTGQPGMTGTLKTHYKSPCPLHTRLYMKGWVRKTEGRKIYASGTLSSGDTLVAEGEALFIRLV